MASNLTLTTVNGECTTAGNLIQTSGSKFTVASNLTFTMLNDVLSTARC